MSLCALNDSSWNVASTTTNVRCALRAIPYQCLLACKHLARRRKRVVLSYNATPRVSMGVVGVKSTAGRAVKCVDPSKTTRSESAWLGYPFCDHIAEYIGAGECNEAIPCANASASYYAYDTLQWRTKVGGSKRIRYPRRPICYIKLWDLNCVVNQLNT